MIALKRHELIDNLEKKGYFVVEHLKRLSLEELRGELNFPLAPAKELKNTGLLAETYAGPGKDQLTTRQQWLKQELPGLNLTFPALPGPRNEKIEYYLEFIKMWKSFQKDVANYVAILASSDEGPFYSFGDFVNVALFDGYNEEFVRSLHQVILTVLFDFHEFEECRVVPAQRFSISSLKENRECR